jgi:hypothetical protein
MRYCTQGFNTFLTALKGGVLNPFGTNKSNDLKFHKQEDEAKTALDGALQAFERSFGYSANMLEARYNAARCKVLMGNTAGALGDLETVIIADRNYCLKIFADSDFDPMQDDYNRLIEGLKMDVFPSVKADYAKIVTVHGLIA